MSDHVIHPDPAAEYWFPEGCHILETRNSPDDPALSVARARVPVGGCTRWHCLDGVTERYLLVAGAGEVEVGDERPQRVGAGDLVVIPAGMRQRIRNLGDEDLVFYALCTPRFRPECYRELDRC